MKLAVAVAGENAASDVFVVWRGFESSIRKAAEMGYNGIELALKTAGDVDPDLLYSWLKSYKLEVGCVSTGQVFASSGLYFTSPDPEIRKEAFEVFSGLIHLASNFGKTVNVGRARGFVAKNQTVSQAEALFIDMMHRLLDVAAPLGVTIIIEPVNRYEINFVNNLDEGSKLLQKVIDNRMDLSKEPGNNIDKFLGLMPDVFHMNIEDNRIGDSLIRNANFVRYIHLADSNRLAPGRGHLDFDEIFTALKAINFDGWASVEILPEPDPDTAAKQAAKYILPRIRRYNEEILHAGL